MAQHIVLGITGGIAAIKTPELAKRLLNQGYRVSVVFTQSAITIISPDEFKKLHIPVYTNLFAAPIDSKKILENRSVEHIDLAKSTDLFVVVPATANILAKLAWGVADDYLTTLALAVTCPVIACPAMNVNMWTHPATQQNIQTLINRSVQIVEPEEGMLACGDVGSGKLASLITIQEYIDQLTRLTTQLKEKTVLVTAGGTVEPIDDVRFIANKSSGKMGVAIAEAAYQRGARVTLLRSKKSVPPRYPMETYEFKTVEELEQLLIKHISFADFCFHAAAVSDFTVTKQKGKLKSDSKQTISLTPRKKLIDQLKKLNPKKIIVGFKAEAGLTDEQLVETAIQKAKTSHVDLIVANHIDRDEQGFGADTNQVWIVDKEKLVQHIPLASKREVAEIILSRVIPASEPGSSKRNLDSRSSPE